MSEHPPNAAGATRVGGSASVPAWPIAPSPASKAHAPTPSSGSLNFAAAAAASAGPKRNGFVLQVRASTWTADSHGLFDYESRNVHGKIFKCNCFRDRYHLIRIGTEVHLLNEDEAMSFINSTAEPRARFLAQLVWSDGGFSLAPGLDTRAAGGGSSNGGVEKLWLVVRTLKDRGVAIRAGDCVKLGRYRLKVKEVVVSAQDAKAINSRRFFAGEEDEDDDCETVAPDVAEGSAEHDLGEGGGLGVAGLTDAAAATSERHPTPAQATSSDNGGTILLTEGNVSRLPRTGETGTHEQRQASRQQQSPSADLLAPPVDAQGGNSANVAVVRGGTGAPTPKLLGPGASNNGRQVAVQGGGREIVMKSLQSKTTMDLRVCRICLCNSDDADSDERTNPMVAPCECKGSMKWVHLLCLRTWMAGRLNIRSDTNMVCFFLHSLECELCKSPYPPVVQIPDCGSLSQAGSFDSKEKEGLVRQGSGIQHGLRTVELFEIPRPQIPYAILEPRHQPGKGLHVLSLAGDKIARLGRGHDSDIRLADISVSRLHAFIKFRRPNNGRRGVGISGGAASQGVWVAGSGGFSTMNIANSGCFVIEDNRSKFGSLLEIQRSFRLDFHGVPISVQVGRTVLTFVFKRRWRLRMPACFRQQSSDVSVVLSQPPPAISTGPPVSLSPSQIPPSGIPGSVSAAPPPAPSPSQQLQQIVPAAASLFRPPHPTTEADAAATSQQPANGIVPLVGAPVEATEAASRNNDAISADEEATEEVLLMD